MDKFNHAINNYLKRTGFAGINPEAALIDMDGTLYDSMPFHAKAWKKLTDELGFNIPEKDFFSYEGMTGTATLELLFRKAGRPVPSEDALRGYYQRKTELFKLYGEKKIMPGAREVISVLAKLGISRVLVTGSGQTSLISKVAEDFDNLFSADAMVTSRDVAKGKPDPEPYLKGMEIAAKPPYECIVIENAPLGIKSGHDSKAFTIGVCTGPIPAQDMKGAGADILFSSMSELAESLPEMITEMRNKL